MCDVCQTTNKRIYRSSIHQKKMEPIELKLCFEHDLELFKRGQEFFLLKYKYELAAIINEALPLDINQDFTDLKFT